MKQGTLLMDLPRSEPAILRVAEVAVPIPVPGPFSYRIPQELESKAKPGVRVRIPFKNREMVAYLVEVKSIPDPGGLKSITEILDEEPLLSPKILELTRWISDYYGSSWGEAIENALPKWVKFGKSAQSIEPDESIASETKANSDLTLSADQRKAMEAIAHALQSKNPKPILLFGVTGSGKSEIYIRAIREVLKKGRSAICLVPEIALTEQLRHFFASHFGNELEILHSKMTDRDRFLGWKRLERGVRRVVLGPRSAIFVPAQKLGLILMDEEHEGSYKQETSPRYHAREAARWRAENEGAVFVMGTATPSLETMYRAEQGEYERVDLPIRIDEKAMPAVTVVDLKNAPSQGKRTAILSLAMISEIQNNLKNKQGTLLLLNRRGFSTQIHCPKCGQVETCIACQVSLIFHQEEEILLCHYCNYRKPVPEACAHCHAPLLRFAGFGTEKVESEVARLFPDARIARMDADSVKKRGSHEAILKEFREQRVDILIGTQMIAKGFDFPHVTLVGVILADVGLMLPDFRSAERTFQLLTQVAGRAGRGKVPGRVLIQTYSPEHASVRFARKHDYLNFYRYETAARSEHGYPPYSHLINFIVRSRDEKKSYLFARSLRDLLKENFDLEMMGPAPLPFYRLRGHFRWHVMLKIKDEKGMAVRINDVLCKLKRPAGVAMAMDVDPVNIL